MRIVGPLIAVVMIVAGAYVAFAGMGWIGTGHKSSGAANGGALLSGLGVALAITVLKRPKR
ncbi:hypothetical protein Back2_25660 [Nocardioides baekrokdamisoli]|uniref:Uncharacterized protein n=1 Tax=Nocardioides baekrokdamisoli TaxID=1804624 RepID=A0A3G9J5L0_9ACTN|nr:hypothetical protein [Nocardioides baekrokdamisoli]BBH18279.1 hypothetical protein Back2_25660 [Nocardioides baekrokdamisoli]